MTGQQRRDRPHTNTGVVDHDLGNRRIDLMIDQECHGAVGDGLAREVVPVERRAAQADVQRTRRDPPRIVHDVGDHDPAAEQVLHLLGAGRITAHVSRPRSWARRDSARCPTRG